ncbi:MAG: hypothetical protein KY457_09075 [Actinobacteria bacterium]|nr:hypothetical protein [Actinomycetota bacterium]
MGPPRYVPLLLVLAVACGPGGDVVAPASPSPTVDRAEQLADVTAAVADVAAAQAAADPLLASALTGVREVDVLVARLRDPATVDTAKDQWPRVASAVDGVDLAPLRPAIRRIAFTVDRARAALAIAERTAPTDWEARYLAAEDETLLAVRTYAQEADALAQVLERYWPTYEAIAALTGPFVERRWVYRSSEEAAAAYEVEISRHLAELARAQASIEEFRERRDEAGRAVNEAVAETREVFRDRPTAEPSVTP